MAHSLRRKTVQVSNPQKLIRAVEDKDLKAFKDAINDPLVNVNAYDVAIDSSIFDKILRTPFSSEFIKACAEKGHLNSDYSAQQFLSCLESLCTENLTAFFDLAKRFKATPKIEILQEGLYILVMLFTDEDSETVFNCIRILFDNNCDGLKMIPMISPDSPFLTLMRKQAIPTKSGTKLLKLFMENSFIGPYPCAHIYDGNTPFSKGALYMESLLKKGKNDSFKKHLKDFEKKCKLVTENETKVQQFNKIIADYDKVVESSNSNKLVDITKDNYVLDCERFLQLATTNAMTDVVDFLLTTNISLKIKNSIKVACIKGHHEILDLFLAKCETIESVHNLQLLHEVCLRTNRRNEENPKVNYQKCFLLLINKFPALIHETDDGKNTPLHVATMTSRRNKDEIVRLLMEGSGLTTRNVAKIMPIEGVSRKALEGYFNECVSVPNDDDEVEVDYKFLLPPSAQKLKSPKETFLLHQIVKRPELRPLVVHGVIASFVYLKWWKLRYCTLANFGLVLLFMISMTTFVYSSRFQDEYRRVNLVARAVFGVSTALIATRELMQILMSGLKHFKSLTNWLELTLVGCSIYCIIRGFHEYTTIPLFMITGYEVYRLLGTLPFWCLSTYRAILEKVMKTFLKSIGVFIIIPLSFALSFNTLYFYSIHNNAILDNATATVPTVITADDSFNTFRHPFYSIIKVFAMMTGEFDTSSMSIEEDFPICFLFVAFMFIVTIVLFNLLNALAISDTQQILDEGEMADLCMKINIMHDNEESIYRNNCLIWLKEMILGKMCVFPHLRDGTITINLCDRKIKWNGYKCDLESGRFGIFCQTMEKKAVHKLQAIVNESNEQKENEKHKAELEASIKSMEKLLIETLKRLDDRD